MGKNLLEKIWDARTVRKLPNGQTQLFIDIHLVHEVTSPQAFGMLKELGLKVRYPKRTFATVDHIVPTDENKEPYSDILADAMISAMRKNCKDSGITFFDTHSGKQGILHVVGPEQGITQPGTTIACGDSHTSTHGAFGTIAFGIGTSQIRDILATQTIALNKLKVRRINIDGKLAPGVYAKDVILHIIRVLGVNGGTGYAYEYGGEVLDRFSMEERMTVCNMSIEGGARVGYVNPDSTTYEYLLGRAYSPKGSAWEDAVENWKTFASDEDCDYDDIVAIRAEDIAPTVTWGINPGQAIFIDENIPDPDQTTDDEKNNVLEALDHMKFVPNSPIKGKKIDVAFIGSCTNARISDLQETAKYVEGHHVVPNVKALVVPGTQVVAKIAEEMGLDKIFKKAGFEWRGAGCSMCLAMNADRLEPGQRCASTSNRNFEGRQGRGGRTHLMSPAMASAEAVMGHITDVRDLT